MQGGIKRQLHDFKQRYCDITIDEKGTLKTIKNSITLSETKPAIYYLKETPATSMFCQWPLLAVIGCVRKLFCLAVAVSDFVLHVYVPHFLHFFR